MNQTDEKSDQEPAINRFKVVKIVSNEPFKKGRWVCMDYFDQKPGANQPTQQSKDVNVNQAALQQAVSNITTPQSPKPPEPPNQNVQFQQQQQPQHLQQQISQTQIPQQQQTQQSQVHQQVLQQQQGQQQQQQQQQVHQQQNIQQHVQQQVQQQQQPVQLQQQQQQVQQQQQPVQLQQQLQQQHQHQQVQQQQIQQQQHVQQQQTQKQQTQQHVHQPSQQQQIQQQPQQIHQQSQQQQLLQQQQQQQPHQQSQYQSMENPSSNFQFSQPSNLQQQSQSYQGPQQMPINGPVITKEAQFQNIPTNQQQLPPSSMPPLLSQSVQGIGGVEYQNILSGHPSPQVIGSGMHNINNEQRGVTQTQMIQAHQIPQNQQQYQQQTKNFPFNQIHSGDLPLKMSAYETPYQQPSINPNENYERIRSTSLSIKPPTKNRYFPPFNATQLHQAKEISQSLHQVSPKIPSGENVFFYPPQQHVPQQQQQHQIQQNYYSNPQTSSSGYVHQDTQPSTPQSQMQGILSQGSLLQHQLSQIPSLPTSTQQMHPSQSYGQPSQSQLGMVDSSSPGGNLTDLLDAQKIPQQQQHSVPKSPLPYSPQQMPFKNFPTSSQSTISQLQQSNPLACGDVAFSSNPKYGEDNPVQFYGYPEDLERASGTNTVAIDNKIEQAMDLVKSHLMFAVREEVEVLKEKISELMERINQLESENTILKANASQETLAQLSTSSNATGPTNP